jgi:hypothetical protein
MKIFAKFAGENISALRRFMARLSSFGSRLWSDE